MRRARMTFVFVWSLALGLPASASSNVAGGVVSRYALELASITEPYREAVLKRGWTEAEAIEDLSRMFRSDADQIYLDGLRKQIHSSALVIPRAVRPIAHGYELTVPGGRSFKMTAEGERLAINGRTIPLDHGAERAVEAARRALKVTFVVRRFIPWAFLPEAYAGVPAVQLIGIAASLFMLGWNTNKKIRNSDTLTMLKFLSDVNKICSAEHTAGRYFAGSRSEIALNLLREHKLYDPDGDVAKDECENIGDQDLEFRGRSSNHRVRVSAIQMREFCFLIGGIGECLTRYRKNRPLPYQRDALATPAGQ